MKKELDEQFLFRWIRPEEGEEAGKIEQICFPPNEACSMENMKKRAQHVSETFLVAEDRQTGRLAGFINGLATNEKVFRDEFFKDHTIHDPKGHTIMILGLDVLPEYRGRGLARAIVEEYAERGRQAGRERLVLTCLPEKIAMYEKFGFQDLGVSASEWGGEAWHEMDLMLT